MKVTLERLTESRVQLDIEVDQERVDKSFEAAFRRLAPRARIPGFRPGKAPRPLIEKALGRDRIMGEALDKLVPDVYNEVMETEDVDAIAQPSLDNMELDPVRFRFIVAVRPTVSLNDHRAIRIEAKPVGVTDEALAEQLMLLRRRHAMYVPVERPVQWNDMLIADINATVEDGDFINDEDAEFPVREGQPLLFAGVAEALLGMNPGETKEFALEVPADFRVERFQGKTANFTAKLKEVKEEQLPDEDDDFAAMVNAEEFDGIQALKDRIRGDMATQLEAEEKNRLRNEAIDRLVEVTTFDYPVVMVDREIDHMIREVMGTDQKQYGLYLQRVGRSEAEYRETLREAAVERVRRSLALTRLSEVEKVDVTPDDVEAEIDKLVAPMGDDASRFREMFTTLEGIATIRRNLTSERTLDRLAAIVTGEAPELPASTAEEAVDAEPAEAESKEDAPA